MVRYVPSPKPRRGPQHVIAQVLEVSNLRSHRWIEPGNIVDELCICCGWERSSWQPWYPSTQLLISSCTSFSVPWFACNLCHGWKWEIWQLNGQDALPWARPRMFHLRCTVISLNIMGLSLSVGAKPASWAQMLPSQSEHQEVLVILAQWV